MLRLSLDDRYETMPWDQLDTIVFDVGNVLLSFQPDKILQEYFPEHPEMHGRLMTKVFRSPYWMMLDHGTISYEEAIDAMTGREEDLRPYVIYILRNWHDLKTVIPEGLRTMENAKAHGKRILILSNYHNNAFEYVQNKFRFFDMADGFVVSAHLLMMKPAMEIYQYTVDRYGLIPERTLFIDDTAVNIEAALHAGWQGFWYSSPGKMDRFFGNPV